MFWKQRRWNTKEASHLERQVFLALADAAPSEEISSALVSQIENVLEVARYQEGRDYWATFVYRYGVRALPFAASAMIARLALEAGEGGRLKFAETYSDGGLVSRLRFIEVALEGVRGLKVEVRETTWLAVDGLPGLPREASRAPEFLDLPEEYFRASQDADEWAGPRGALVDPRNLEEVVMPGYGPVVPALDLRELGAICWSRTARTWLLFESLNDVEDPPLEALFGPWVEWVKGNQGPPDPWSGG